MAKKNKERKTPEVLVFTDINNYADDMASMVVLAYLADKKLINIKGVVTGLGVYEVKRRRAMFAKGVLNYLGYPFVRAAPGGDTIIQDEEAENHYITHELTPLFESAGLTIARSGTIFIQEYFKTVKDKIVYILMNAPADDLVKYIKSTHDTLVKKVKKIVIMGNVLKQKDENGFYKPDLTSFNFKYGKDAANFLFDYIQQKDIRTTIVPREAIKELQSDYSYLDEIQKSKNPVYKYLYDLKDKTNPDTMVYDMISALCLVDGLFKANGGAIEKEEGCEKNISFASITDAPIMRAKLCEIFKEKLETKVISLSHLSRSKPQQIKEKSNV